MTPLKKRPSAYALSFLLVVLASASVFCWWWIDSYQTCPDQDEHSLRGACLIKIKKQAEDGQVGSQWTYADYLYNAEKKEEAEKWHQIAMRSSTKGTDIWGTLIGHCDKTPNFDHKTVEEKIKGIARVSPDANLLLLSLYLTRNCGAFSLEKASAIIPLVNQCAHLTLADYIRIAEDKKYRITGKIISEIETNLKICQHAMQHNTSDGSQVQEIIPPGEDSLKKLSEMLFKLRNS